ncbi:MAG: HAMP domain-containing histidine kinase [Hymenobacteraceae bacterium]|nr:HAMP domain-containing histidine kinase [Hymenobacteraceae bacterium]MDX5396814.1 HAMP domain-containing histidine kinase [Hymenobacteraceae bacterium]MDX5512882.1 HAMP domain-containing histidine kinase [Hymenobacteraceae bacterium]
MRRAVPYLKQYLPPGLLLLIAVFCFVAAVVLNLNVPFFTKASDTSDQNVRLVNTAVHRALSVAKQDVALIRKRVLRQEFSFNHLSERTTYPTFLFDGEQLVLWTDHRLEPDFELLHQRTAFKTIENKYGKFLVTRQKLAPDYTILNYIPLERYFGISNHYLSTGLNDRIFRNLRATIIIDKKSHFPEIRAKNGTYLFSLQLLDPPYSERNGNATILFLTLGLSFFIAFVVVYHRRIMKAGKSLQGILVLLFSLLLLRATLLFLDLPFSIVELSLFDPKWYAASFWSPSVGDLLLNTILLASVSWYLVYRFRKHHLLLRVQTIQPKYAGWIRWGGMLLFYGLLLVLYHSYLSVFRNSLPVLDITQSMEFNMYKVCLYMALVLQTVTFLAAAYILVKIFGLVSSVPLKRLRFIVLAGALIAILAISGWAHLPYLLMLSITGIFFIVVVLSGLKQDIVRSPYQTYLFIFLVFGVSAIAGSVALNHHYLSQLQAYKQKFATNYMLENDLLGEFLLEDVSGKIEQDLLIRSKLMEPYVDEDFIRQKIVKYYLRDYFDKYRTTVTIFDATGRLANQKDTTNTVEGYKSALLKRAVPTVHKKLFLVKPDHRQNTRKYVKVLKIPISNGHSATILLELELKKMTQYSVLPELLVDQKYAQPMLNEQISFAIFENKLLQYSEGSFDYINQLRPYLLQLPKLYQEGVNVDGFHHYAVKSNDGRTLLITTEQYAFDDLLSNFSFLFLIHGFGLLLYILLYLVVRGHYLSHFKMTFSTKIQLFLNFGILVPLILVSVTTVGLVTNSYKRDLVKAYEQQGKQVQENLSVFQSKFAKNTEKEPWTYAVTEISEFSETDINLYDREGKLLVSSQPLIFEAGLLSKLINPEAYNELAERQALRVLLDEQAGSFRFHSLYLPLRTQEVSKEIIGYIGIPFFDSEKELDRKLIELITTSMNIFTVMFIIFMILTFIASRTLTVPLKMITQKLKSFTFTGKNETISYFSDDEIGLLVNEYNLMLYKLEQSKKELAAREKEAAWREMARQVAHEIKNPLTPMKLSLQYLQKAISENRPNTQELINKISQTMITQIDVLSDIATSFSHFTSMPDPKPERIDIAAVLKKSIDLHDDPAKVMIKQNVAAGEWFVMADENLMVRTFNNLIINALQAIPASRAPELEVSLQPQPQNKVQISIHDNGTGIPEEIQNKVFVPNFSTKYHGSGIGLAVAKRGIESAGGRIWFNTEADKGTTFFIELPLDKA